MKANIMSKTPRMVNAIFAHETFSHANKITRAGRINLQKQKVILPPYLLLTVNDKESLINMSRLTTGDLKIYSQIPGQ
jgi:hypothetical protein